MAGTMLSSWNDGETKTAIMDFVESVSSPGAGFVPAADRIAAFDNDGTLWVERPLPPQLEFLTRVWLRAAQDDPLLASVQPYKAVLERDSAFFAGLASQDPETVATVEAAVAHSWAGTTPETFDAEVREWLATVRQPRFGVGYLELVYQPMLELFDYLKAHEFRIFVCSGGGRDFMRVFAEQTWGLFKEHVIGSAADYEYKDAQIVRSERLLGGLSLGPGKPEHIFARTGRLPLLAGGNADVDIEMLTTARFALLVNHDDPDREYAYTVGAENSLAQAAQLGWTVASMKHDWARMFA
jgi:phosphoserine phosphatase